MSEKEKIKWRCYICGKTISGYFALVSMAEETDRAFLVCSKDCALRAKDSYVVYVMRRSPAQRT
jgi:hypothetical protein